MPALNWRQATIDSRTFFATSDKVDSVGAALRYCVQFDVRDRQYSLLVEGEGYGKLTWHDDCDRAKAATQKIEDSLTVEGVKA